MEVRHPSFLDPLFFTLLRRHGVAFVVADTAGKWPYAEDLTADFVYVRLHGAEQLYVSGYGEAALQEWARRMRLWSRGRQPRDAHLVTPRATGPAHPRAVFAFFDNDAKVHAPFDALTLAKMLAAKG